MPLYRKQLDDAGCEMPGCTHANHDDALYLRAACHPRGRLEVSYRRGSGTLRVGCMECGKDVAIVAVADAPVEPV